jgi:cytochrome c oxidase cbb3-type subunit IV
MFSNNLSAIEGVSIYPMIGLAIFVTIFTLWIIYALRLDKKEVEELENLPLDSSTNENNQK